MRGNETKNLALGDTGQRWYMGVRANEHPVRDPIRVAICWLFRM